MWRADEAEHVLEHEGVAMGPGKVPGWGCGAAQPALGLCGWQAQVSLSWPQNLSPSGPAGPRTSSMGLQSSLPLFCGLREGAGGWGDLGTVGVLSSWPAGHPCGCRAELEPFPPSLACAGSKATPTLPWQSICAQKPLPYSEALGSSSSPRITKNPRHSTGRTRGSQEDSAAQSGITHAAWGPLSAGVTGKLWGGRLARGILLGRGEGPADLLPSLWGFLWV